MFIKIFSSQLHAFLIIHGLFLGLRSSQNIGFSIYDKFCHFSFYSLFHILNDFVDLFCFLKFIWV